MGRMAHLPGLMVKAMRVTKIVMPMERLRRNHVELELKKMGKFRYFLFVLDCVHHCDSSLLLMYSTTILLLYDFCFLYGSTWKS